jgi:hypothetical protein
VRARDIYLRTVRAFLVRAGYLLALGAAVFVPLGLLDAAANRVSGIQVLSPSELTDPGNVAIIAGLVLQALTSLLGEVFYAGAVGLALRQGERSAPPPLRAVARRLSYRRLIAVDVLFGLGTAIGLLLLIVPGIVFFAWFALAGPLVELEGVTVRRAFARSRQLVRGSFWTVLVVLLPITLASELLTDAALDLVHRVIHEPLLSDWAGEALTNILLSPFYAVAAVLMTLELSGRVNQPGRGVSRRASGQAGGGTSARPA